MSGVPENTPVPPEPTPTPIPIPTPDPAPAPDPAPPPEPVKESEGKTLATEPVFDPEKLTLPEGFEKGEHFDHFKTWATEAGINQPQAEKLINLYSDVIKQQSEAVAAAWEKTNADWQTEVKADKELGGANLQVVKQTISKMLDNSDMTDPKFREALDFTGAGNNPAVIRTLYRWAQKLTEGASVAGGAPARDGNGALANRPENLAQAIYGPAGPHTGGPRLG